MVFTLPNYPGQSPVQIKRLDATIMSGEQLDSVLGRALTIPGVAAAAAAVVQNNRIDLRLSPSDDVLSVPLRHSQS